MDVAMTGNAWTSPPGHGLSRFPGRRQFIVGAFMIEEPRYMSAIDSDEEEQQSWVEWFAGLKGNEYFCQVESDYVFDKFNLTGLGPGIEHFRKAYDLVTDAYDESEDGDERLDIEKSARIFYGLVHARYILTSAGLSRMHAKYINADFGHCPRILCRNQPLLPVGLSDLPNLGGVKLFCAQCEDVYQPKSTRHYTIDGAFFGTTFPHLFLQTYKDLIPAKSTEKYVPKIFGFAVAESSRTLPPKQP